jgi:peptide/nickel transport system substrate-binding protein
MSATRIALAATLLAATALTAVSAEARTLRWARVGDSLTLDPHAQNEGATHTLAHHVYEPLAMRNQKGDLVPGLATSWRTLPNDPTVWEFKLRQNVKFHNGAPSTPTTWCSRSTARCSPPPR